MVSAAAASKKGVYCKNAAGVCDQDERRDPATHAVGPSSHTVTMCHFPSLTRSGAVKETMTEPSEKSVDSRPRDIMTAMKSLPVLSALTDMIKAFVCKGQPAAYMQQVVPR